MPQPARNPLLPSCADSPDRESETSLVTDRAGGAASEVPRALPSESPGVLGKRLRNPEFAESELSQTDPVRIEAKVERTVVFPGIHRHRATS